MTITSPTVFTLMLMNGETAEATFVVNQPTDPIALDLEDN